MKTWTDRKNKNQIQIHQKQFFNPKHLRKPKDTKKQTEQPTTTTYPKQPRLMRAKLEQQLGTSWNI